MTVLMRSESDIVTDITQRNMGYCQNCGEELAENVSFCPECGASVDNGGSAETGRSRRTTGSQESYRRDTGAGGTISTALNYPKNRDGAATNPILVGSFLNLLVAIPVLGLIPATFLTGYGVKTFRSSVEGDPEPPRFTQWGKLFVDGLKGGFLILVYFAVPILILIGTFVMATPAQPAYGYSTGPDMGTIFAGLLFSLPFFLIGGYFLPAALAGFARTDRIGSGFNVSQIFDATVDGEYFMGWLKAFFLYVLYLVGVIFLFFLNVIPFLGLIIFFAGVTVLQFYIPVAMIYVFGRSYAGALRLRSKYPEKSETDSRRSVSEP